MDSDTMTANVMRMGKGMMNGLELIPRHWERKRGWKKKYQEKKIFWWGGAQNDSPSLGWKHTAVLILKQCTSQFQEGSNGDNLWFEIVTSIDISDGIGFPIGKIRDDDLMEIMLVALRHRSCGIDQGLVSEWWCW